MKKLFVLIILINCISTNAQEDSKNDLQIITTANLTDNDKKKFYTDFWQEFKKNRKLKKRFDVNITYFLSKDLPTKIEDIESIQGMITVKNEKFENEKEFTDALKSKFIDGKKDLCKIYYSSGNLDLGKEEFDNMKDVFRWIKKIKKTIFF